MSARTGGAYVGFKGGLDLASGGVDHLSHVDFTGVWVINLQVVVSKPVSLARPTRWVRERLLELLYPVLLFVMVGLCYHPTLV